MAPDPLDDYLALPVIRPDEDPDDVEIPDDLFLDATPYHHAEVAVLGKLRELAGETKVVSISLLTLASKVRIGTVDLVTYALGRLEARGVVARTPAGSVSLYRILGARRPLEILPERQGRGKIDRGSGEPRGSNPHE